MADRDDKNLAHFKARAGSVKLTGVDKNNDMNTPVNVFIVMDNGGWGQSTDISGWTHVGTSPQINSLDVSRARRRVQLFMADQ